MNEEGRKEEVIILLSTTTNRTLSVHAINNNNDMNNMISQRLLLQHIRAKNQICSRRLLSQQFLSCTSSLASSNNNGGKTYSYTTATATATTAAAAATSTTSAATTTSASHFKILSPLHCNHFQKMSFSSETTPNENEVNTESTTTAVAAAAATETPTPIEEGMPEQFTRDRPPSILSQTFQNDETSFHTGQAWSVLNKHLAGGEQIRHEDFVSLCTAARAQHPKDAKLLIKILKDLKRCNRFILTKELAKLSVENMFRSLSSEGNLNDTPIFKARCGLVIGEAFANQNTGLYVSLDTDVLEERVLEPLYNGLLGLQEELDIMRSSNDDEEEYEKKEETAKELVTKGMNLSKQMFDTLLTRAAVPTKDMKKRAKRKYLRYSRCSSGPTPTAIDLMVRICLLQVRHEKNYGDLGQVVGGDDDDDDDDGNAEETQQESMNGISIAKSIIDAFEEKQFLGKASNDVQTWILEAEEMLNSPSEGGEEETAETDAESDGTETDAETEEKKNE